MERITMVPDGDVIRHLRRVKHREGIEHGNGEGSGASIVAVR
jgi:hypothetical protein